jgi:hypothetical protein
LEGGRVTDIIKRIGFEWLCIAIAGIAVCIFIATGSTMLSKLSDVNKGLMFFAVIAFYAVWLVFSWFTNTPTYDSGETKERTRFGY